MEGADRPAAASAGLWRNLSLDLVAAGGVGITLSLVVSLLPTVARRGGLDPIGLAALAAAPFLANLVGVFAGRIGPRSPRQLALLRAGGAGLLVLVLLGPGPTLLVAVVTGYWLSLSLGGPLHVQVWGVIYPPRLRGRAIGAIGMSRAGAGAAAALAAAIAADRLGGEVMLALAGVVGIACSAAYAGLRAREPVALPSFSARESIRALSGHPVLRRLALAQGFYGGGLIAAMPLYALVHVDRLGLSLGDVGVIGILAGVATTVSFVAWGALSDRFGSLLILRVGSVLGTVSLVGYAVAPAVEVLWLSAVAFGLAAAAVDTGIVAAVSHHTSVDQRAPAMAGWNAITGIRGIAAPFVMSGLVQAGLIDVALGLVICAVVAAIGFAIFLRVRAPRLLPVSLPRFRRLAPAPDSGALPNG